jgi:hypothetical protein
MYLKIKRLLRRSTPRNDQKITFWTIPRYFELCEIDKMTGFPIKSEWTIEPAAIIYNY